MPLGCSSAEACVSEQGLIQQLLPVDDSTASDCRCLTLNVAVPDGASGVPVLAFIHGGGFKTGSANWPQNSLARLARHAALGGLPVIAVGIK